MYKPLKKKKFIKRGRRKTFFKSKRSFNSIGNKISYNNRKFSARRSKKDRKGLFLRLYLTLGLILLAFTFYFLFFSNIFKIKKIVVVNNNEIEQSEIDKAFEDFRRNKILFIFPVDNLFLLSKNNLRNHFIETMPKLRDVELDKKLLDVIKLDVKEKKISAVWVSGNDLHYVDEYGLICCTASIEDVAVRDLPYIYDLNNKEININDEVATQKFIGFLIELNRIFPENINTKVRKFWVPSILSREVHLETIDGWKAYFSIDRSVSSQLRDLMTVIDEQIKGRLNSVEYIDLRVENWIYYK